MYVLIVLGRLGCKQIICLGYVYVLWLDPHVAHTHVCSGKVACSYDHSILAQAPGLILVESFENPPTHTHANRNYVVAR